MSTHTSTHATWLNLGAAGLPRDVRRLIGKYLRPEDKILVGAAHNRKYIWCPHDTPSDRACDYDRARSSQCNWARLKYWCAVSGNDILMRMIAIYPQLHRTHPLGRYVWYGAIGGGHTEFMRQLPYERGVNGALWWMGYVSIASHITARTSIETLEFMAAIARLSLNDCFKGAIANGSPELVRHITANYVICGCGTGRKLASGCTVPACDMANSYSPWGEGSYTSAFRAGNMVAAEYLMSLGIKISTGVATNILQDLCGQDISIRVIIAIMRWLNSHRIHIQHWAGQRLYRAAIWGCEPERGVLLKLLEDAKFTITYDVRMELYRAPEVYALVKHRIEIAPARQLEEAVHCRAFSVIPHIVTTPELSLLEMLWEHGEYAVFDALYQRVRENLIAHSVCKESVD